MRIFISYAHVDWQFVDKLTNRLRRYHDVWFDERLHAGQAWWQAILERINWCECFIYILSPESLASQYCRDEYAEARNLAKHIVPIRLQPNIELPDTLQRIQYADFSTRRFEDALTDLVGDLGRLELQATVQVAPSPAPQRQRTSPPPSKVQVDHIEVFREAVEARQADDHETALRLFNTLAQTAPDFLPEQVAGLIQHSQTELKRQARRKEYDRLYQQVSLLTLDPFTLEDARRMWVDLQNDFPEIDDDPEVLASVFYEVEAQFEEGRRQRMETEWAPPEAGEEHVQSATVEEADSSHESDVAPAQNVVHDPVPTTQRRIREINPLWIVGGVIGAGLLVGILLLTGALGGGREPAASAHSTGLPTELAMTEDADAAQTVTPSLQPMDTPTNAVPSAPEPTRNPAYVLAEEGVEANEEWEIYTEEVNGVEMALVPAGCFQMGSTAGADDEEPIHEVCFNEPFWIDVYEVTNEQYGGPSYDCYPAYSAVSLGDEQPRICTNWLDALAYCESRGARLPTEAEWEYAAGGPDSLIYPWGNEFVADNVVYGGNSGSRPGVVGSRPGGISWIGAHDLSGNVWEWVDDWYYSVYYGTLADGVINPQGPESSPEDKRVFRGGSFYEDPYSIRNATRGRGYPSVSSLYVGFRCARAY